MARRRGNNCVCLLAYEKLGHLEIVLYACVCCLTQHVCQSMMSVVSVSTSEGGVTADVLPLS